MKKAGKHLIFKPLLHTYEGMSKCFQSEFPTATIHYNLETPSLNVTRSHTGVVLRNGSPAPLELIDKLLCARNGNGWSKSKVTNSCSCCILGE